MFAKAAAIAVVSIGVVACSGSKGESEKTPITPQPAEAAPANTPERAQLDSGNVAYRAKQYDQALKYYQAATKLKPDFSAAWFGVYMAQEKLGNKAGAAEAMKRAKDLGAAALMHHPTSADTSK